MDMFTRGRFEDHVIYRLLQDSVDEILADESLNKQSKIDALFVLVFNSYAYKTSLIPEERKVLRHRALMAL
jgi:hypothetical protein